MAFVDAILVLIFFEGFMNHCHVVRAMTDGRAAGGHGTFRVGSQFNTNKVVSLCATVTIRVFRKSIKQFLSPLYCSKARADLRNWKRQAGRPAAPMQCVDESGAHFEEFL